VKEVEMLRLQSLAGSLSIVLLVAAVWVAAACDAIASCEAYGDVNGDGIPLTIADLVAAVAFVNCDVPPDGPLYEGDLNGDCVLDHGDLEMFECYFHPDGGMSCFDAYPVPTCCEIATVRGACLESDDCHIRTEPNCSVAGGDYLGDGTLCDKDGDALPDCWEMYGYDHDGDDVVDVDLQSMGADWMRKDVFVEIDWMEEGFDESQSHRPKPAAIDRVVASFANSLATNPDGSTGINLHVDFGQGGVWNGGNEVPHDFNLDPVWEQFSAIKSANFLPERAKIFHYCLFAHRFGGTSISGLSFNPVPAADFLVTLGDIWDFGTEEVQAGTFMHELGHNLGLEHGGFLDIYNCKPNYLSVMNYLFSNSGIMIDGVWGHFDYSSVQLQELNESSLDETVGIDPRVNLYRLGSRCYCTNTDENPFVILSIIDPVDFNCNGNATELDVSGDINKDGFEYFLPGRSDWSKLIYDIGALGQTGKTSCLPENPTTDIESQGNLSWEEYQTLCVRRGDADNSHYCDIDDVVFLISYIFAGGEPPVTPPNGDADGSETIDIDDPVYLINYIFQAGDKPACF
jgi:hypothetical protein